MGFIALQGVEPLPTPDPGTPSTQQILGRFLLPNRLVLVDFHMGFSCADDHDGMPRQR
jgi:hypothetical protein